MTDDEAIARALEVKGRPIAAGLTRAGIVIPRNLKREAAAKPNKRAADYL